MNYGFVKIGAAIPNVAVANPAQNQKYLVELVRQAAEQRIQVVAFPELCLTGYTCGDLFGQDLLLQEAEEALLRFLIDTQDLNVISIVGLPIAVGARLLNTAVVCYAGRTLGIVPKTYLSNYKEFYEQRWFVSDDTLGEITHINLLGNRIPIGTELLFKAGDMQFGIELCEDAWAPVTPGATRALQGADIVFNLSASNESISKHAYVQTLIAQNSAAGICGYVYAGCGFGESTTDLVFAGRAFIYENGTLLAEGKRFQREAQLVSADIDVQRLRAERRVNKTFSACATHWNLAQARCLDSEYQSEPFVISRIFPPHPFVPTGAELDARCEEIFSIQITGLAKRLLHTQAKTLVIGVSGGLDSTLALLVCVKACDWLNWERRRVLALTMPGFGTTKRTHHNAVALMKTLGVTMREIDIRPACEQHFKDIGHDATVHDVTYENSQARERTQILMDVANQTGGLVVGTGDLSELALGWATYNGDHMSMYGVNVSIPKTLVRHLVQWVADHRVDTDTKATLSDIIATPISPELIPADEQGNIAQKTEDLVGPYELHDFFLYYFLRFGTRPAKLFFMAQRAFVSVYDAQTIKHWLYTFFRRFFSQQFKRSCLPDGPKVGSVALSPRGDWRMPSDAQADAWLHEIEHLPIEEIPSA
ncbi:MAG: NAD(+) synthase [Prevotellaceae bacterium]|jgi:NAD+ synthase (glutamine-hydrolysing)|nr:NAD(+) synthase [Prevotellaceae bacterium]